MAVKGVQYLRLDLLVTSRPQPRGRPDRTGGILDPILGHAVLLTRHRDRDRRADRASPPRCGSSSTGARAGSRARVESGIEVIAGTPDIVLAIFGLALFQQRLFALAVVHRLGRRASSGARSCGRRDDVAHRAAARLRRHARGAAGDPRARARGVLGARQDADRDDPPRAAARRSRRTSPPARRSAWAGSSATRRSSSSCSAPRCASSPRATSPVVGLLRGTGSTLTSYVYNNSPAGEGNAPQKAYAAAFVLLLIVLGLNFAVDRSPRRGAQTGLESTRLR